ncbi:hypothetical protein MPER_12225 [Moniliophthora perniciosa FA553]|nr:hypothetical protein MPER_12225 [Moniliophthora perniciosa FA553]
MEFIPASPVDEKSKTQRQMKNRRRAMTKSKSLDMELLKLFDLDIPENQDEVDEAKGFSYLDAFRSEDLINDIMQSAVVQQEVVVDRSDLPAQLALPIETVERVESSAYPRVQPMKSALYFDTPEGFGDWLIFIGPSADSELRRRHKRERTTFDIIVKKMKELSNGHFSPDNHKRLGKSGSKSAVYEAKMTSDLRLVYQVDLVPNSDERVRQAIKIFGIFTHAQMENNRIWESIDHQLGRKSKEYKEYCAIRQRVLGADSHTFTPAYFPPLPEGLDDMQPC